MTTHNARLNAAADRNTQIKVLSMQYALQARTENESMDVVIENAAKIYEYMKDTGPSSLEVVRSFVPPDAA